MALDPAYFVDYPDIAKGDRVRYASMRHGKRVTGVGTVTLIWLGVEEMCDIQHDDGTTVSVCRSIGDEVTSNDGPTSATERAR